MQNCPERVMQCSLLGRAVAFCTIYSYYQRGFSIDIRCKQQRTKRSFMRSTSHIKFRQEDQLLLEIKIEQTTGQ